MDDEYFMREAIKEAKKALDIGDVPIGAVIVKDGEIIARGHNRRNNDKNPLSHAEIIAINQAAGVIGDWRIEGCCIYVTIEPCPMCSGAIVQARIPKVVYGAANPKAGCGGSVANILQMDGLNHKCEIVSGLLADECGQMMKKYKKKFRRNVVKEELEAK